MDQKILLIEDDLELAEHITHILNLAQYNVIHACNGIEGVEKAIAQLPDLIISGVEIPSLNGYGVIQILSHHKKTEKIPFVFLSKKASKEEIRLGMNLGADDYITKPIEAGELLKTIEVRLRKRCFPTSKKETRKDDSPPMPELNLENFEISDFLKNKRIRNIRKKDFIFMEGQIPGNLYWIKSGKVKNFKTNSFGKELITSIQGEEEFLGHLPLLKNASYEESAEALEDVELYVIPKEEFLAFIKSSKLLSLQFIQLLSKELMDMEDRMIDLAYQPVRQRVARVLLNLGRKFKSWDNSNAITMSRKDISNIIGTAPETLNRMLSEFKEEGIIEISDLGLNVKDIKKLSKLAKN